MPVSLDPAVKVAVLEERLEGHEKVCAERYGEISKSFDRIHGRLDWIMRGIIGLLAAMLAWVVVNGVPWPAI
jgi:hypothetical protein